MSGSSTTSLEASTSLRERLAYAMARRWVRQPGTLQLLSHRENTVYRVENPADRPFILRLLRPDYNRYRELCSEVDWINYMHQQGLSVPTPLVSLSGQYLHRFKKNGTTSYANASRLVVGQSLAGLLDKFTNHRTSIRRLWFELGALVARMHRLSDDYAASADCRRRHWDVKALIGRAPHWGRFWRSPLLDNQQRQLMHRVRQRLRRDCEKFMHRGSEYGLIHCDLNPHNIFIDQDSDQLSVIDFDDGGFGYRLYDIVISLIHWYETPHFSSARLVFLEGYATVRPAPNYQESDWDMMALLRALSLLGWISDRLHECEDPSRPRRITDRAVRWATAYMNRQ